MSETTTGARAAHLGSVYPDAIGFGFAEMAALLNLAPGEAATKSAAALRIPDEAVDPRMIAAGASSLVARGQATAGPDGVLSVSGPVAAVTTALTSAVRRVELSLLAPDNSDSILLIESADVAVLLQPRSHLTWFALAPKPGPDGAETVLSVIHAQLEEHPDGGVIVKNRETPEAAELLVKRSGGAWTVGRKYPATDAVESESGLSEEELLTRIRAVRQD